ncbi:hypothetical protein TMatcc_009772 [Talaromyces marneffei ATCC 18224]|uniref:Uncharacterized protein n=2 Tax=Talaromyces marneffei TaxID=37727 RepID=B6QT85_TALMQ|nr:conserved hypothetical protein [Talaromyces marneffei ATCC 18224]KAE8547946.1 hypothetical protein EYB25_009739 [Talaromyces marneffei]
MSTPTLINLPPPPSDPVTPSDMGPGTPNSGTTSLSALSTTAIKDGHQGHPHPHARHTHQSSSASATSTSTLEAERADRISRLAGLERIATARAGGGGGGGGNQNIVSGVGSLAPTVTSGHFGQQPYSANNNNNYNNQQGYFDSYPQQLLKERSTVGSASATGSVGGQTTWASGSDAFDPDKMSEDQDHDSSVSDDVDDRMSDEGNASLVGFGEGANSTISGPISTISAPAGGGGGSGVGAPGGLVRLQSSSSTGTNPRPSTFGSPPGNQNSGGFGSNNPYATISQQQQRFFTPSPAGSNTPEPCDDARMVDGMTYDSDIVDTTVRTPRLVGGPNDQDSPGGR